MEENDDESGHACHAAAIGEVDVGHVSEEKQQPMEKTVQEFFDRKIFAGS